MPSDSSLSHWIRELKQGQPAAAEHIWQCYFPQLVRFASKKLRGLPCCAADEEDVALCVLDCFFRAAERGRFPRLADREALWHLLMRMTKHKVVDLVRHETHLRRGARRMQDGERPSRNIMTSGSHRLIDVADDTVAPEQAIMLAEECRCRLQRLEPDLQSLALAKMEGYHNDEIARRLQCSVRTIERRLHQIRDIWEADRIV